MRSDPRPPASANAGTVPPPRRAAPTARARAAAVLGGALALAALAALSLRPGNPGPWSPFPMAVVIPLFAVDELVRHHAPQWTAFAAAVAAVPLAFLTWTVPLLRGRDAIPRRSRWAALGIGIAALAWLAAFGSVGVESQGAAYVATLAAMNLLFAAGLGATLFVEARRRPSLATGLAFHLLLFGWVAWCAFPWLGGS